MSIKRADRVSIVRTQRMQTQRIQTQRDFAVNRICRRARLCLAADVNGSSARSHRLPPRKSCGVAINAQRWWLEAVHGRICLRDKCRGNRVVALWRGKIGAVAERLLVMLIKRLKLRSVHASYASIKPELVALGIALDYGLTRDLPVKSEPECLLSAGNDRFRRLIWLRADARLAWLAMQACARQANVALDIVSAFRSQHYQAELVRRKLNRGAAIAEILKVSAAPGFSEHHTGCAVDVSGPGLPVLEESFADSAAFLWLQENAHHFGFIMSFPPENRHGVLYEPWHWCYHPRNTRRSNNIECEV